MFELMIEITDIGLWSNESRFTICQSGGCQNTRRTPGECNVHTVKSGGEQIMAWGCFSGFGPLSSSEGGMLMLQDTNIFYTTTVACTDP